MAFSGARAASQTASMPASIAGRAARTIPRRCGENRARVTAALAPGAKLVTLAQIHSANVHVVGADWDARPSRRRRHGHRPAGLMLGIQTADCAPVLFADAKAGVIGAAHAGWKGALGGVLEAVVAAMEGLGARRAESPPPSAPALPRPITKWAADFREHFFAEDPGSAGFSPPGSGRNISASTCPVMPPTGWPGRESADIARSGLCTYPPENGFFSFRRTTHRGEADYGREISAIVLTEQRPGKVWPRGFP